MNRPMDRSKPVDMTFWQRRKASTVLRSLGHSPEWWRVDAVRYAHCLRCDGTWVGRRANRRDWASRLQRSAGQCPGKRGR